VGKDIGADREGVADDRLASKAPAVDVRLDRFDDDVGDSRRKPSRR
jgi:hypothetical protein